MSRSTRRVLLAGESWTSFGTHVKGWDHFSASEYETGGDQWVRAVEDGGFEVTWIPAERVPKDFPLTIEELSQFAVVVLSDIGARSLLLHPNVWRHGQPMPNRLNLLREWVVSGGGLCMCGGYLSFAGMGGSAGYAGTAIDDILPVTVDRLDDLVEVPEGASPDAGKSGHRLSVCFAAPWPLFLGYNRAKARPEAEVVATVRGDPFVATRRVGAGRSLVWMSDIGPHWCPEPVVSDPRFGRFWVDALEYLGGTETDASAGPLPAAGVARRDDDE
jgi:uncharacterized membrane protein